LVVAAAWAALFFLAFRGKQKKHVPLTVRRFTLIAMLLFSPPAFGIIAIIMHQSSLAFSGYIGAGIGAAASILYNLVKR
jgi:hypothetical protein